MSTWLHDQRLEAVQSAIGSRSPASIVDLGCGAGDLLTQLVQEPRIERVTGVDLSRTALDRLRARLRALADRAVADVQLVCGSMTEAGAGFTGFDCALLIEVIEHVEPDRLSTLEHRVFRQMRPTTVVVTTPNAEFNPLLGVPRHRLRHPDHHFEWSRAKFQHWVDGIAHRNGYQAARQDIAGSHPDLGGASQMAVFDKRMLSASDPTPSTAT